MVRARSAIEVNSKVIILAAGEGKRLRTKKKNETKAQTKVYGLSLIQRAILSAKKAGLSNFVVVVGYKKEILIPYLKKISKIHDVSIEVVENPQWKKGNGTSVYACHDCIKGNFFILMCDHLFDSSILKELLRKNPPENGAILAIDKNIDKVFDLGDATKVQYRDGSIIKIGKNLKSFNAIDTGIFFCTPIIFTALESAFRERKYSLSDGIAKIINLGKMKAYDIGNKFWLDIDTEQSLKYAKRALLSQLNKISEDGFISRFVNRPISKRISVIFSYFPISPNIITIISFIIGLAAAFMFTKGNYFFTLFAGLLVQLSSIIDGCDGEIARLKFQGSPFGAWFDTILDRYVDTAISIGIGYSFWLTHPGVLPWIGCILALVGFILASYLKKDEPYWALISIGIISHIGIGWSFLEIYFRKNHTGRA
jgi:CDP-L-myo-inositol myo-inositolphosphotransferase